MSYLTDFLIFIPAFEYYLSKNEACVFFCQEYETDVGHHTILCPKLICKKCHQIGHFAMDCETFCDKFHEVKVQNNIHNSISEVEDLKNQVKSLEIQIEELRMKLESFQSKPQTRKKNRFKQKSEVERKQEKTEQEIGLEDILKERKYLLD